MHALGFTSALFGAYIDPSTLKLRGSGDVGRVQRTPDGKEVRRSRGGAAVWKTMVLVDCLSVLCSLESPSELWFLG